MCAAQAFVRYCPSPRPQIVPFVHQFQKLVGLAQRVSGPAVNFAVHSPPKTITMHEVIALLHFILR